MTFSPGLFSFMALAIYFAVSVPLVRAQDTMSFTEDEAAGEASLFERVETPQGGETDQKTISFEEGAVAEHDALACAAGLGCDRVAVSQDEALVLTGHNTPDVARQAYREQYGDPVADEPNPAGEREGEQTSSSNEEAEKPESLFERLQGEERGENGKGTMEFEEGAVAEHDALACAAGLGCEGLAVSQDEALVLTGHNNAETALAEYRKQYGEPDLAADEAPTKPDLSVDTKTGEMSFTGDEAAENLNGMAFSEEEVGGNQARGLSNDRFSSAEIASFSQEQDELWACAAAFGCKGAAAGHTPHEALHRLGLPEYSYEWPLAACATNAPGACKELGLSLGDALRIMSHLANPNR